MFTEKDLAALLDDWLKAPDPTHVIWLARWADACAALGLPCYPDGRREEMWCDWLEGAAVEGAPMPVG